MRPIDADALIQNYCVACANKEFCAEESCQYYEIRRRIETAPTIEPEVRHGRWVMNNPYGIKCCSECGYGQSIGAENYCPNCGKR